MQFGDPELGELREEVQFAASGETFTTTVSSMDNEAFTVTGADGFELLDIGDEHVRGIEFWHTVDGLGLATGATLADIRVAGFVGDSPADVMPGTYHLGGQMVPGETGTPATLVLAGPAALFNVTIDMPFAAVNGTGEGSVLINSPLNAMGQFLNITYSVQGNLSTPADGVLNLDPRGTRRVTVSLDGAMPGDVLVMDVQSDLASYTQMTIPLDVQVPPAPAPEPTGEETPGEDSPGLPIGLAIVAMVVLLGRKR